MAAAPARDIVSTRSIISTVPHLPPPSTPPLLFRQSSYHRFPTTLLRAGRCAAPLPPRSLVYSGNGSSARGSYDPELRFVLELATDEELFQLEDILFGTSYFSPALKSIAEKPGLDYALWNQDIEGRGDFITCLESRFLFLAADARSTLRGQRPSYRNVLLGIRRQLRICCPSHLSTEDLEVEIYLHLLSKYSCQKNAEDQLPWDCVGFSTQYDNVEFGLSKWKINVFVALREGAKEVQKIFLKGGGIVTFAKLYQLLEKRLSGKMFVEAANYQIKHELLKKGGRFAAINLESRAGMLAARMGFTRAASNYLGLRSIMSLLGPVLWGTLLADVVVQMLGTDYARILRAIFAFAQIRLTRSKAWSTTET